MGSLVGHAVTVYLPEEAPPLRLEGRIEEDRDGLLEVRLTRRELDSLKAVLRRTFRVELEYAVGRDVWGVQCQVERYVTSFPPVLALRPAAGPHLVNHRRHLRYATNQPVRLIIPPPTARADEPAGPERYYDGRLINVSRGGAGVTMPREAAEAFPGLFALKEEVVLQFVALEMVKPRARVVRRDEGPDTLFLGLEFVSLTSHDTFSLESYLGQLAGAEVAATR